MSRILPAFMTQSEYARHRGISRQRVSVAIRQGKISLSENGRIDVRKADSDWLKPGLRGRAPRPLPKKSLTARRRAS